MNIKNNKIIVNAKDWIEIGRKNNWIKSAQGTPQFNVKGLQKAIESINKVYHKTSGEFINLFMTAVRNNGFDDSEFYMDDYTVNYETHKEFKKNIGNGFMLKINAYRMPSGNYEIVSQLLRGQ